jgi:hypothetical protein
MVTYYVEEIDENKKDCNEKRHIYLTFTFALNQLIVENQWNALFSIHQPIFFVD